jgi:hypothetical protein
MLFENEKIPFIKKMQNILLAKIVELLTPLQNRKFIFLMTLDVINGCRNFHRTTGGISIFRSLKFNIHILFWALRNLRMVY